MKLSSIWNALSKSLSKGEKQILSHIKKMAVEKKTAFIEKQFSELFQAELKEASARQVKTEVPLKTLGGKNFWSGTTRGSVDIYLPTMKLGIECKAVRLPRNKDTELFDISQLASDTFRIRSCKELQHGYIMIFVYGPLVEGTTSKIQLSGVSQWSICGFDYRQTEDCCRNRVRRMALTLPPCREAWVGLRVERQLAAHRGCDQKNGKGRRNLH